MEIREKSAMGGIHRLSAARVRTAKVGRHADGGNLYLDVKQGARGLTKKWVFRYAVDGHEYWMGLGALYTIGIAEARERARAARQQLLDGIDPIEHRKARIAEQRLAAMQALTFREAALQYIDSHDGGWRSPKHRRDWIDTLNAYVHPVIGGLPVQAISVDLVLQALEPIWLEKTETASRLRGRIEMVLDFAKARGLREGDNPASWDVLQHLLPKPSRVKPKQHFKAMPYADVGQFMAELRELDGGAGRALEFLILTAARSGEVRGARWDEIDGNVWTIPPPRTKAHREHRVPLCARAVEILAEMRAVRTGDLIFEGRRGAISVQGLLDVLSHTGRKGITVHGFRSTFRSWCGARTNFPREVAEMALAHRIGDATEQAYARDDLFDKRRKLMDAWGKFCAAPSAGDAVVTPLRSA
jgi:integrase